MVVYGSIDALIWVCKTSKNITLHHLTTTVLATLAQKGIIHFVTNSLLIILFRVYTACHHHQVGFTRLAFFNPQLYPDNT